MNIQRVKQGAKIAYYNGFYMILLGVLYIIFINFNMNIIFGNFYQLWGFFTKYNSNIAFLFYLFNIQIGIFLISQGISFVYLSEYIIRRKEKITWVILFISGLVTWGGLLTISVFLKNIFLIAASFFGWLTFLVGMLLPVQYYLEKNYREY